MVPAPLPPAEAAAQAGGEGRPLAQPGECACLLPACVLTESTVHIRACYKRRRLCACCVGMLCVLLWFAAGVGWGEEALSPQAAALLSAAFGCVALPSFDHRHLSF